MIWLQQAFLKSFVLCPLFCELVRYLGALLFELRCQYDFDSKR
jgi:hypothetical protein